MAAWRPSHRDMPSCCCEGHPSHDSVATVVVATVVCCRVLVVCSKVVCSNVVLCVGYYRWQSFYPLQHLCLLTRHLRRSHMLSSTTTCPRRRPRLVATTMVLPLAPIVTVTITTMLAASFYLPLPVGWATLRTRSLRHSESHTFRCLAVVMHKPLGRQLRAAIQRLLRRRRLQRRR